MEYYENIILAQKTYIHGVNYIMNWFCPNCARIRAPCTKCACGAHLCPIFGCDNIIIGENICDICFKKEDV